MIIKSLKMKNYRPYKGPITIDFAHSEDKNITIIMGDNDLGKTTILNAISWCLYDDEHYKVSDGKLYNNEAQKKLRKNEPLDVVVQVDMEDNVGKTIEFKRTQRYVKKGNKIKAVGDSKFSAREITDSNDEEKPNPKGYRETILPKSLQEYFLFDGERLLDWFEKDSKAVKDAVKRLSQLDLIDNVMKRTNQRISDLEDEISVLNPQKAVFIDKKQKLLQQKKQDEDKITENKKLIEEYNNDIREYREIIENLGEDPAKLLKQIDEYKTDINKWEKQKNEKNKDHTKYLIDNIPFVLGSSLIEKNIILRKPKNVDADLNFSFDSNDIMNILDREECICGHHIDEDDESYQILLELKTKLEENEKNSQSVRQFKKLSKNAENILNKSPNVGNEISKYASAIADIEEIISEKKKELKTAKIEYDALNEKYKDVDKGELDKKIENREKLIEGCNRKIWNSEKNLTEFPSKLSEINKRIEQEEIKSEKENVINDKIAMCRDIIVTCDLLRGKVKTDIHNRLQNEVNNEFKSIYNGDGERNKYKSIKIDDSFDIFFEELDGTIIPSSRPSSGTQLVAALSFITALNSCSGFKLPQVMDTSLGRWGDRIRGNFADTLPYYSKNKQMVFLFLDSEYNLEFRDKIDDYVGKKYKLTYISPDETGVEIWEDKYE